MRKLLAAARGGGAFLPPPQFTVSGPYDPAFTPGATVLTQLHCHTTQSDGVKTPATVVSNYLSAGYGALVITDHDKVTSQPSGITTAIPGNEHSPTTQHLIAINSSFVRSGQTDAQQLVDLVLGSGGQVQVAHPKWFRGMTPAALIALNGHLGFEIHNSHCVQGSGQNPVTYPGFAVDIWDQILASRRTEKGFSVDDLHMEDAYRTFDVGRTHVFAASNTAPNVMASLVAGNFVADVSNHGVTPGYPVRTPVDVSLTCAGARRMEMWGTDGLLQSASGDSITHPFDVSQAYVRAVAVGGYTETFDAALPRHWQAVDGTWGVSGGSLNVTSTATARRNILRRQREGDFEAEIDVELSNDGTDAIALMFNVLNADFYYMLFFGASANSAYNNRLSVGVTTNNTFSTSPLGSHAITPTAGTVYTMKMAYVAATGLIQAKVWAAAGAEPGPWQISVADTTWRHGAFGVRANRSCKAHRLDITGLRTYYQPILIDGS